jgi:hypothetical protein
VFNNPAALEHPVRWALIHGAFALATTVANLVTDAAMYEVKRQGRCGVAVHGRGVVRSARPRPVAAAA